MVSRRRNKGRRSTLARSRLLLSDRNLDVARLGWKHAVDARTRSLNPPDAGSTMNAPCHLLLARLRPDLPASEGISSLATAAPTFDAGHVTAGPRPLAAPGLLVLAELETMGMHDAQ